MMRKILFLLALLLLPAHAIAAGGVVSAADPRAAEAGRAILARGGSAADAAMAMMLALTVVEPQSSGIGGGGFLLHHDATTGRIASIDGRETAPAAARPDRFIGEDGKPLPFVEAWIGGASVGVPGNIRLMAETHRRWGKLPWADLFAPAIALAEGGFVVTPRLNGALTRIGRFWQDFPQARAIYWIDGKPAAVGATIRNPALGELLRNVATGGADAFYTGDNARAITEAVARSPRNPATLSAADLAGYEAKERPPVCGQYRSHRVCGMGPPSSGAVAVLQILGMLERFDLKAMGKDNPVAWHLIAEAMRLAYADRETWLGDRDFVSVPVAGLIDPVYLASRSALISPARRIGRYLPGTPPGSTARTPAPSGEVPGTTHFVAIDGAGNIATMTSTVEASFGSQIVANGMILNNELTDFSFVPEQEGKPVANRVEPGKRPLSSMSPTIVYDAAGRPVFTVGAAGGKTIIMQVAKALIAHLDWGLDAEAAIALPLVYFRGDALVLEESPHFAAIRPALEKLGHTVTTTEMPLKANAAQCVAGGWRGAADPRSEGVALAE